MFARPPAQREWVSWLGVVLWSLLIFATIPLARAIEGVVVDAWGKQFFLYAVLIVIGAATVATFRYLRSLGHDLGHARRATGGRRVGIWCLHVLAAPQRGGSGPLRGVRRAGPARLSGADASHA